MCTVFAGPERVVTVMQNVQQRAPEVVYSKEPEIVYAPPIVTRGEAIQQHVVVEQPVVVHQYVEPPRKLQPARIDIVHHEPVREPIRQVQVETVVPARRVAATYKSDWTEADESRKQVTRQELHSKADEIYHALSNVTLGTSTNFLLFSKLFSRRVNYMCTSKLSCACI